MRADRTDGGRFSGYMDMAAVGAFPHDDTVLLEYLALFHVLEQGQIALLMFLLNRGYALKELGDRVKTLFTRLFGKLGIHIGPLIVFAGSGVLEVLHRVRHAAVQQLRAWGREPFWAYYSELQYRHVDKKLLIEEYIGTPDGTLPEDYKFYCFHGRADCVMLCAGRDEGWPKFYFFDRDFQLLRINRDSQAAPEGFTLPKPAGLDEAFAIADRLSKPFDFVRVDLYLTPHGVRFGELTFTPAAALDNKRLPETDLRFGRRMEETL